MKKNLQLIFTFTVCALIFCFSETAFSQTRPIVGGYKTVSVEDEGVVEAAEFAAKTQAEKQEIAIEISSINKAERQTVAGMNYRLCVSASILDEGEDAEIKQFSVIIFKSLKKVFTLKSWKEEKCSEEE